MSGSSQRSLKLGRLPESSLPGAQSGGETTKRTSVFERLGSRPLQTKLALSCNYERKEAINETRKTVTPKKLTAESDESDLRNKFRRNRLSVSPPSMRHVSSLSPKDSPKNDQKRTLSKCVILQPNAPKDETKIKSLIGLVSVPTKKSPSPGHIRAVELASRVKRAKCEECDDDADQQELEQRRQQLKKELEELGEIEKRKREMGEELLRKGRNNYGSLTGTCSSSDSRSLCSSAASSANASYCTDTSYSNSGSSCSHSSDEHKVKRRRSRSPTPTGSLRTSRRSPHHIPPKTSNQPRSRSPRTPPRSVSSSSLPRRSRPLTPPHEPSKQSDMKYDRHGNIRISLREKERQRKLEREHAMQRQRSPVRYDSKDAMIDDRRYSRHDTRKPEYSSTESGRIPITNRLRSHSRSPRRSRESTPERRRMEERRRYEHHEIDKDRRYERDDYKREPLKSVGDARDYRRHERDAVSRPRTPSSLKGYRNDEDEPRNKMKANYEDNKYYDKDNKKSNSPSSYSRSPPHSTYRYDSKNEKNRVDCDKERFVWDGKKSPHSYTCDLSPPQSLNSKRSRASSVGSDLSRPSLSNRSLLSRKSARKEPPNKHSSAELPSQSSIKDDLTKISDASKSKTTALHTTEDMSPISNNSSFGDLVENETSINDSKCEKSVVDAKEKRSSKKKSETEENFSDWSDGDDDLILQSGNNDVDATDDVGSYCSRSQRSQEKDNVKYVDDSSRTSAVDATTDSQDGYSRKQDDDALEAISDDELDAIIGEPEPLDACNESNSASGQKLLDALEIDWSSLVCESQPPAPGSARKRFTPANVFAAIGFSQALAGPELTAKIIECCKEEQRDAFKPFRHPVAALHCFINEQLEEREKIFGKSTLHSIALNAPRDMQIRKFLSKWDSLLIDDCQTFRESNLVS